MKYIIGGIGDFLQCVDDAQKEQAIKVYSHFLGAKSFFEGVGVKIDFSYFKDLSFLKEGHLVQSSQVQRRAFQGFSIPEKSLEFASKNANNKASIIGLHPVGSKFSNNIYSSAGVPLKIIPPQILKKIINKDNYYFIFGSKEELVEYKREIQTNNVQWIDYEDIWDSLAHVAFCRKVITVDSSIKTMASVKKIPSIVFAGNFRDDIRDAYFLNPYVDAGVMKVFKFNDIVKQENEIINFINNHQ